MFPSSPLRGTSPKERCKRRFRCKRHTFRKKIKNAAENSAADFIAGTSDSALNLVGAEASGTCVNMAGSSVNDSLNALDVGLPCTIGTSVGVRDLNAEGHALTTKITLSHSLHLPSLNTQ